MTLLKACLAGAVTMMVLGGLFHLVLAGDFLSGQLPDSATMPGPGLVALFVLPVTLIMAYLYPKVYEGGIPAMDSGSALSSASLWCCRSTSSSSGCLASPLGPQSSTSHGT